MRHLDEGGGIPLISKTGRLRESVAQLGAFRLLEEALGFRLAQCRATSPWAIPAIRMFWMEREKPRDFAIQAHGDQMYGERPYSYHLDAVAVIAGQYGETAKTVAYLHDTVEDTSVTLDEVRAKFGDLVADCLGLLTDEPGANRKERKAKTYAKLAQVHGELELALIVKVADRLANVRACIEDGNQRLLEVYRSEHPTFRQAAYRLGLCDELWVELDKAFA